MHAIVLAKHGGPAELKPARITIPEPAAGEVRVKMRCAGLNFIETYQRSGLYPLELPVVLGAEGGGVVDAIGAGVSGWQTGDVVVSTSFKGSYAEFSCAPASRLVPCPPRIDLDVAVAALLQGMTAHMLSTDVVAIGKESAVLVHAAAGGVGALLVQLAAQRGARVIGTASNAEKEQIARLAGAHDVIRYTERDFVREIATLTNGAGVDVVFDSVGKDTFLRGLECLKPRGMMVSYGQSSGAVEPLAPLLLTQKGSLFLTRPSLTHYTASTEDLRRRAGDVLRWCSEGVLDVRIDRRLPLAQAALAHELIASRKTNGKVLLMCDESVDRA